MNHMKKTSLCIGAALTLGISGTSFAAMDNPGSQSGTDVSPSASTEDALTVYEPTLVFSDGAWFSVSDGDWYSLGSDGNWYMLDDGTAVSGFDAASSDDASNFYAMDDGTLYSYEDGQWYVWVPVEYVASPDAFETAAYDASGNVAYDVHLYDMNGNEVYGFTDAQPVSSSSMSYDAAPSYIVYLQ